MKAIVFVEGDPKNLELTLKEEMIKPIKHFEKEISTIRTGRASAALVENVPVECYGQTMPIKELATIAIPDVRLITIQPWIRLTRSTTTALPASSPAWPKSCLPRRSLLNEGGPATPSCPTSCPT